MPRIINIERGFTELLRKEEAQLMLTNRATRLEVSQAHKT